MAVPVDQHNGIIDYMMNVQPDQKAFWVDPSNGLCTFLVCVL